MKNIRIYLSIVLILTAVAVYFYFSVKKSTIPLELRDFAIEDTASVTKIFLTNKSNQKIILEKKNNNWMLNDKYFVRRDLLNVLLETISGLEVKSPVSESAHNNVVKNLAATATKVEIYINYEKKPEKVYYVGGPTQDNMGTYMVLENSSVPFIMHLRSSNGYLTTRYIVNENEWRDRTIFFYSFRDILSVTVEYPAEPEKSFKVINHGNNTFDLIPMEAKMNIAWFDTIGVKQFIAQYKKVCFESFIEIFSDRKRDSLLALTPLNIFTVESRDHIKKSVKTYRRPNLKKDVDEEGNLYPYDAERMYAILDDDKEVVVIQYYVFDPLIAEFSRFINRQPS